MLSRRGRSGSSSGSGGSGFGGGAGGGGGLGAGGGGRGGSGGQARSVVSVQFGQDASITADPATNSLIILTDKGQYEKIKSLIDKLDIKRRQVLVEAMLLEVSIDNTQTLGFDFLTSTGGADGGVLAQSSLGGQQGLQGLLSDPRAISGFSIAAASRGSLHLPGGIIIPSQAVMLSALQSNQNVNVLSAPTLLATDNEAAEIVVGQNVPFLASTSTNQANLNNTFNQIDRQDVGITLRLTPQISSEDFVKLSIFTNVSDIVPTAATNLGPTTTVRSSETTVITKDSQMIAIGGLMADQNNESDNGVPFLKNIPILGQAFQRSTARRLRTNLLTFITPHIVKDQFDNRDMTISQRDRIQTAVQESKTGPDRHELLQNPAIDDVADIDKSEVQAPGTIRPQAEELAGSARQQSGQPQSEVQRRSLRSALPSGAVAPLALNVAPPLPPGAVPAQVASAAPLGSGTVATSTTRPEYFVLRVLQSPANVTDLPISADGMVGIVVPEGTGPEYRAFFRLGRKLSFGTPTGNITLQVAEKHLTPEIAQQTHQIAAESWHTLSPHELLSLGSGPWTAEGQAPKR
jgi:Flp pilus assembly secretin CpaC